LKVWGVGGRVSGRVSEWLGGDFNTEGAEGTEKYRGKIKGTGLKTRRYKIGGVDAWNAKIKYDSIDRMRA